MEETTVSGVENETPRDMRMKSALTVITPWSREDFLDIGVAALLFAHLAALLYEWETSSGCVAWIIGCRIDSAEIQWKQTRRRETAILKMKLVL